MTDDDLSLKADFLAEYDRCSTEGGYLGLTARDYFAGVLDILLYENARGSQWEGDTPKDALVPLPLAVHTVDLPLVCTACRWRMLSSEWRGQCPRCGNGTMREMPLESTRVE